DFVKVKSPLRENCRFETLNLIDLESIRKFGGATPFDIVFCRNVFIYFEPEQIRKITQELLKRLHPTGYLFVGISESLHGLGLETTNQGPSIYSPLQPEKKRVVAEKPSSVPSVPPTIRVLC